MTDDDDDDDVPNKPATRTRDHTDIRQFCWLVAAGHTQTESARQAAIRKLGEDMPVHHLAAQRANKLMKRPDVQELIATLREQVSADMAQRYAISRESIIRDLVDIQRKCMQAEPVKDGQGEPTGEYRFDAAGAIKATELLGKELGMFVQRVKHEHSVADLTDEQLIQRARNAVLRLTAVEAALEPAGPGSADPRDSGHRGEGASSFN